MTTPNSSDSTHENTETSKRSSNKNINSLLKFGIERELGNPIDPRKFDAYKKEPDYNNIRLNMKDLCKEDPVNLGDIDEETIDQETTDEKISDQIARMGTTLILRRKRAFDRALELFPTIGKDQTDVNTLRIEIAKYDEDELLTMITKSAAMRKMVRSIQKFKDAEPRNSTEKRKLDDIFIEVNTYFPNEIDRKKLKRIYYDYYKYGEPPDGDDIDWILGHYVEIPPNEKKKILTSLEATLTLKDAYNWGLINDSFIENLAQDGFGDLYLQLNSEQKESFVRGLGKNESYNIAASNFDENNLKTLFLNKKERRELAQQVFISIIEDMPEVPPKPDDFASTISKKKKAEAAQKGVEEEDWDLFEEFVKELALLRGANGTQPIQNVESLKEGAYVQFTHGNGSSQYIRIVKTHDDRGRGFSHQIAGGDRGVEIEGVNVTNGILTKGSSLSTTYEGFMDFFKNSKDIKVLSSDFDGRLTGKMDDVRTEGSDKVYDASALTDHVDENNIRAKIDLLDGAGMKYGFDTGTYFIAPAEEIGKDGTKKTLNDEVWKVDKIHDGMIDLADANGLTSHSRDIPLQTFFDTISSAGGFRRVSKITDDHDFLHGLEEGFDLPHGAEIKDGQIIYKDHESHGNAEHGEASHEEVEKKITCFSTEDGGHIRIYEIKGGNVLFGEFDSSEKMEALQAHAEKYGIDKTIKGQYKDNQMSYGAFIEYLKNGKLKASKKDLIAPDAEHTHEGHGYHPHLHGGFWGKILKMQNPASIWKGFEMIIHGIEQKLEKGAKLEAARFALRTSRGLGLPDTVIAEVFATVVEGSKEILEKTKKEINNLPGPKQRLECLHIVQNIDARPEDVGAAMAYMLDGYGHLYAEDIKHKQSKVYNKKQCITAPRGTFLFFDAFVMTSGMGNLPFWRERAYTRALSEMGTEEKHEGEPTEEQLIHTLFKTLDGNWEKYPYAASVMKAMGGPGGFERMWKIEGYKKAYEKGKEQTTMVNAQGRLHKGVSYGSTNELHKYIGAMENMALKIKSPEYQAMPFIWACGGWSGHVSHTALQHLKGYAENGLSFHAFSFLRSEADNNIYRDTVKLAIQDLITQGKMKSEDGLEFSTLCRRLAMPEDSDAEKKKNPKWKPAPMMMMEFWQKHQGSGLHNMLQGQNGWLIKKQAYGDKTAKAYWDKIAPKGAGHGMQLMKSTIPGGTNFGPDWYDEHGYQNIIIAEGEDSDGNKTGLMSLHSMLNKIQFQVSGGGKEMNDDHREKIWQYIKKYMTDTDKLRDLKGFLGDQDLQKKQYLAHRKEILEYIVRQLNTRASRVGESQESIKKNAQAIIRAYPYFKDLADMGIDPMAVFDADIDQNNGESDYNNWINGRTSHMVPSAKVTDIASLFAKKAVDNVVNDGLFEEAA